VFYTLNGYLLAANISSSSRSGTCRSPSQGAPPPSSRAMFGGGVVIAFLVLDPRPGLVHPAFAAAFMVHVVTSVRRSGVSVRA